MCIGSSNGLGRVVNPNSFIAEKTGIKALSPETVAARKIGGGAGDIIAPQRLFMKNKGQKASQSAELGDTKGINN